MPLLACLLAVAFQAPRIEKLPAITRTAELVWTACGNAATDQVLTVHHNGDINLWDVKLGQEVASYRIPLKNIGSLSFSPDGKLLAVRAYDDQAKLGTLYVFDWALGTLKWRSAAGHEPGPWFHSIAWAHSGHRLAVAETNSASPSIDGSLRTEKNVAVYDGDSGALISWALGPDLGARAVAWQSDDSTILAGGNSIEDNGYTLRQIDPNSGKAIWSATTGKWKQIVALRHRADLGGWLALTDQEGPYSNELFLVAPGKPLRSLWKATRKYMGSDSAIACAGETTLVQTEDDTVWVMKIDRNGVVGTPAKTTNSIVGEFGPNRLVTNYLGVSIFDAQSGSSIRLQARSATAAITGSENAIDPTRPRIVISNAPLYEPDAIAIDRRNMRLAAVLGSQVVLWDMRSRRRLAGWNLGYQRISALEFLPDGRQLRFLSGDGMGVLDIETEKQVGDLAPNAEGTYAAIARNHDSAVVVHSEYALRIFQRSTGIVLCDFKSAIWAPDVIAMSADGQRIAVGASEGIPMILAGEKPGPRPPQTAFIYDQTGKQLHALRCTGKYVSGIAFSPDGKLVAVGSYDYKMPSFKSGATWGATDSPVSKASIEFFDATGAKRFGFSDVQSGQQGFGAVIPKFAWDSDGEFWFCDERSRLTRATVLAGGVEVKERFETSDRLATRLIGQGRSPDAIRLLPKDAWNGSDWPGMVSRSTGSPIVPIGRQLAFGNLLRWPASELGSVQVVSSPTYRVSWTPDRTRVAMAWGKSDFGIDGVRVYDALTGGVIHSIELPPMGTVPLNDLKLLKDGSLVGLVLNQNYIDGGAKDTVTCAVFDMESGRKVLERILKRSKELPDPQYAHWSYDDLRGELVLDHRAIKPGTTSETVIVVERWRSSDFAAVQSPDQTIPEEGARYSVWYDRSKSGSNATVVMDLRAGKPVGELEPAPSGLSSAATAAGGVDSTGQWYFRFYSRPDSGYVSDTVAIWQIPSGKFYGLLSGHRANLAAFAFEPETHRFFTSDETGVIHVWNSDTRKMTLTILFPKVNLGWVAVTPEGFYAADRAALGSVSFRLGNRAVPFDEFDALLNRPDKVLEALGYGGGELASTYRSVVERRQRHIGGGQAIGSDRIEFAGEIPGLVTARELKLRVSPPSKAVGKVLMWVNNVPVFSDGWTPPAGWKGDLPPIELSSGPNKVDVAGLSESGALSVRDTTYVEFAGGSTGLTRIVCVGASDYKDPSRKLDSPAKDASDLAAALKRWKGNESPEPVVLQNSDCTREKILGALKQLESAGVDDTVIVFLAGHGLLDNDKNYIYACTDIDFSNPGLRGLPFSEIEAALIRCKARRKLVLMDTCCSGLVDPDSVPTKGAKVALKPRAGNAGAELKETNAFALMTEGFADLRRASGATIVAAASGVGFALETDKNGYFTQALLECLSEPSLAGVTSVPDLTVGGVRSYVLKRVPELTGGLQRPVVREENLAQDFKLFPKR